MSVYPKISIIIPTRDRPEALAMCLTLLLPQCTGQPSVEVVISDDSATGSARSLEITNSPGVRVVAGPRLGPGPNRNHGASVAVGDWLLFVDDDCLPQPGWLAAYATAFSSADHSQKHVFIGPTSWPDGLPSLAWEAPSNDSESGMPSCNFGLSRTVFMEVGGFDVRFFPAFEDMEFQARLHAVGAMFSFLPSGMVHHAPRRIPSARRMAARWYPQVLYAIDLGAPPDQLFLPYLRHVAGVITSRIREHAQPWKNLGVCPHYLAEFLWVVIFLRGWIQRAQESPRSPFWALPEHRAKVAGYGFGFRTKTAHKCA